MKKKGFTLIELLAVIVILAIIALIATPLVLKYIETSRIESFKVSIENIKDSALKYVASQQLNGKVTYPVAVDVQDLDFKGKEDYTGKVIVRKDGTVEEFIDNKDYIASNSEVLNKKDPYLKIKDGQTGIIDNKRNYVYSFYNGDRYRLFKNTLKVDVMNTIFEVTNDGIIEYVPTVSGSLEYFSTGSKIIVKDKNGNKIKEYTVIIFGDVTGSGVLANPDQVSTLKAMADKTSEFDEIYLFAGDINFDNVVDNIDLDTYRDSISWGRKFDQIQRKYID